LVIVKATNDAGNYFDSQLILRGAQFVFDRASAMQKPAVLNLSLSANLALHDGSGPAERFLASLVGPGNAGRVIVVAAGNSGRLSNPEDVATGRSPAEQIHQIVSVSSNLRARVPIVSRGSVAGAFVALVEQAKGSTLRVGLDSPEGRWIGPVEEGRAVRAVLGRAEALVSRDEAATVIRVSGSWPAGEYAITLEGDGVAHVYLEPVQLRTVGDKPGYTFLKHGAREGTIGIPATHPDLISVGCTLNRGTWESSGGTRRAFFEQLYDAAGGRPLPADDKPENRGPVGRRGAICAFSGAGPNTLGQPKPDIAAPGFGVFSTLSRDVALGAPGTNFQACLRDPLNPGAGRDEACAQVDPNHASSSGTSMSAPVVSGAVALLLQASPTLTQGDVRNLLQAGAHRFRRDIRTFYAQSGPGELDVQGALKALELSQTPARREPASEQSWIHVSNDYAEPGGRPLVVLLMLRGADGLPTGDLENRLHAPGQRHIPLSSEIELEGRVLQGPAWRYRAPGLYAMEFQAPAGAEGTWLTIRARYGNQVVAATPPLPVARDPWKARYPTRLDTNACAFNQSPVNPGYLSLVALLLRRLKRRKGNSSLATALARGRRFQQRWARTRRKAQRETEAPARRTRKPESARPPQA
jgi:subtilisin family serine protease